MDKILLALEKITNIITKHEKNQDSFVEILEIQQKEIDELKEKYERLKQEENRLSIM